MIDNKIFLALSETDLLALLIYGEARGEIYSGKLAVAHVVRNRAAQFSWYGKSIKEVCLKKMQFSCFNEFDPNRKKLLELAEMEEKPTIYAECYKAAKDVLTGNCADITFGATHYCNRKLCDPVWIYSMRKQTEIGNHEFYK